MSLELWTWEALVVAAGGRADGVPCVPITGFSIDSRTLRAGEVFVALRDARDGHDYVPAAFAAGASAALVSYAYRRQPGDGPLLQVADPLAGLEAIARVGRARCAARVVAVTGSVGKTGTKEALRACLARLGPTHAAEKSYNNQWGVPLTLARMPAGSAFAVIEIGMNHRGEIAPLSCLARPHVAVVTAIEPVHLGHLGSLAAIAEEKADIFLGLEPGGTAVIKRDSPHFPLLEKAALARGARVLSFGLHRAADVRAKSAELDEEGADVTAEAGGHTIAYHLGTPGAHVVANSLAVVAALIGLGADLAGALPALAEVRAGAGRGARTRLTAPGGEVLLIDESYNANPASMRAALVALAVLSRARWPRRIAVLGDMLELGAQAGELHVGLKEAIDVAGIDLVFACGPNMQQLFVKLEPGRRGAWAETSAGLAGPLADAVGAGDVVMIKGSLGSRMSPLAEALRNRFAS